ncbi:hypothetical protein RAMDARK_1844 [Rickettsia amblyommatis str. Darkwater]|nr:hypothetical protein RAMDARK_1844 [Rickettsia amblyommatis str. Darkwater]
MSTRSIEETAALIMRIYYNRKINIIIKDFHYLQVEAVLYNFIYEYRCCPYESETTLCYS